jgi:hypothetical protein
VVAPLEEEALNPPLLRTLTGEYPTQVSGAYVGMTTAAAYPAVGGTSALAQDLPDDPIVARADLAALIALYRPLVEMGMMAMSQPGAMAQIDSTGTMPQMTPEMIAAVQDLMRDLMDSLRQLDISIGHAGELTRVRSALTAVPGSILEPGPQPDFAEALPLTRFIPPHVPLVQASALDVSSVWSHFTELYRHLATFTNEAMPEETAAAYAAWMADGLQLTDLWGRTYAVGLGADADGMRIYGVMEHPAAEAALQRIIDYYSRINGLGLGVSLAEQPQRNLAGVAVRSFEFTIDPTKLAELAEPPASGTDESTSPAEIAELVDRLYPTIWATALPGHVVFAADPDAAAMGDLIQQVQSGRGSVRADVQAAAAAAVPGTQSLVVGDLRQLVAALIAWLSFLEEEPPAVPPGDPIPVVMTQGLRGTTWDFALESDLAGIVDIIAVLEEMGD